MITTVITTGGAMAKKQPKRGTCAHCASVDVDLTIEHVFPESWYPDEYPPSQMLTVPTCSPCNRELGRAEERLFAPLAMSLPTDPRLESMMERVYRSVDPSVARNARDARHRKGRGHAIMRRTEVHEPTEDIEAVWTRMGRPLAALVTEGGVHFRAALTIPLPWEDQEAVAKKFLRGCYYEHVGKALPADADCCVVAFDKDPRPLWDEWVTNAAKVPGAVIRGAFPFEYAFAAMPSRRDSAGAMFRLWDAVYLFAAANMPRAKERRG